MNTDHPVINRAREIAEGEKETEDRGSLTIRIDAIFQALSEATGMREPVWSDKQAYFDEFTSETYKKTGLNGDLVAGFLSDGVERGEFLKE